jgi:hypothetical protein
MLINVVTSAYLYHFRNLTTVENCIAVIIAVVVGAIGALVLSANFYYDFWVFMFCFVIAGCQYSVMKVNLLLYLQCSTYN